MKSALLWCLANQQKGSRSKEESMKLEWTGNDEDGYRARVGKKIYAVVRLNAMNELWEPRIINVYDDDMEQKVVPLPTEKLHRLHGERLDLPGYRREKNNPYRHFVQPVPTAAEAKAIAEAAETAA
jgi:hypothetical protein